MEVLEVVLMFGLLKELLDGDGAMLWVLEWFALFAMFEKLVNVGNNDGVCWFCNMRADILIVLEPPIDVFEADPVEVQELTELCRLIE